ncbi:EcoAI/FtnUII family type I restriction enzme subunit R [Luteolibacter marinus]|uniref:EcoAI/FtnUII family type I restriction enzme subunit R n=1 Tax=Luteolibacter marinus TaxID=2776705 RepID=UPI0018672AA1|nr:DEAD/DEAH box helicase family protein [Luteolibacter marinus]
MNKKDLKEADIRTKFITPAIQKAGWDIMTQVREEVYFTKGRIVVRGKLVARGKPKVADYLLYSGDIPIAIVEAKDNKHEVADGLQQGLDYAVTLDVPFAFSSNGDGFAFHDRTGTFPEVETEFGMDDFPSPELLRAKYDEWKGLTPAEAKVVATPYHDDGEKKEPRYYQRIAIDRTIEAIARGQDRILLVMATGTGKTYTAFQIIWRLWRSGAKKRILFLADRNVLVDQTMVSDFRPFEKAMAKLSAKSKTIQKKDGTKAKISTAIRKGRQIDTAYEIYLGLYQALTGPKEKDKIYKELSPDFFDLIIIDECHRGSAAEDSAWREILEHFAGATQIGLTATPKETEYVSNMHYFGQPLYTYSLKQGIEDGFLAPYKVVKIHIDKDVEGYRPEPGKVDVDGEVVEDRIYNQKDYDRNLIIDERTRIVARTVTRYLSEAKDPYQKTIVFCVDTEHALRMRKALIDENQQLVKEDPRYIMRITGNDKWGIDELDNFIDPESRYPVIVTTSRLLSTGVDAQTCKLIVLDREVGSMTEFKQIIGRGTRIHEEENKLYFTLIDFRQATNHFADKDFDGDPVQIYEPKGDDPVLPPDPEEPETPSGGLHEEEGPYQTGGEPPEIPGPPGGNGGPEPRRKIRVNGVAVSILAERVEYYGDDGKLVTESLRDYSRKTILGDYASLDEFLKTWKGADRKATVLEEMEAHGLAIDVLRDDVDPDLDAFDLICHVAYGQPPLTRRERAENVRKRDVFTQYGVEARAVLQALLDRYADGGILDLEDPTVLHQKPFNEIGRPLEIAAFFGGAEGYRKAIRELEDSLYPAA